MKIFPEIIGNSNQISKEYNDEIVKLRIECGNKRSGEKPKNLLAKILEKFGLSENSLYWDIKENIWKLLKINETPIRISQEHGTILEKNIANAADIPILRNTEGSLLLKALNLPQETEKESCENILIEKILYTKFEIKNKPTKKRKTLNIHQKTKQKKFYDIEDPKALEGYQADKKYLYTKRNRGIVEERKKQDRYTCQVCDFKLKINEKYIIECHHLTPFTKKKMRLTNINDLVSLCPTCHRIAHTRKPSFLMQELKKIRKNSS